MAVEDNSLGEAVLVLTTDNNGFRMGIDDAHMAANAMQHRLDEMQNHIKDRFAEKFEHIGVHLFGRDMLQAVGITEGARPIIGGMQMAVGELAETFGVAAGPVGVLVMGLGALAAVGWKVHESHEKHLEDLDKLVKKEDDALKSTDDLKRGIEEYNTAMKGATPELNNLYDATVKLDAAERHRSSHLHGEAMSAAQELIRSLQEQKVKLDEAIEKQVEMTIAQGGAVDKEHALATLRRAASAQYDDIAFKLTEQRKKYEEHKATVDALAGGAQNLTDKFKEGEDAAKKHAEAVKQAGEEYKKTEGILTHLGLLTKEVEQDGAAATTSAYDKKRAEIEKYRIVKQAEINRLHAEALEHATTNTQILAANRQFSDATIALSKTVTQKTRENFDEVKKVGVDAANTMAAGFGDAFAKSIVEGKNFEDSMKKLSTQIAEQIISDLIRVAIQAQITKAAVGGIFSGGGGAAVAGIV